MDFYLEHALDVAYKNAFLIYYYKNEIKIKKGDVTLNRIFEPYDNPNYYHTKLHDFPLQIKYGKVWCKDEEDIPLAIEIVEQSRIRYLTEIINRYEKIRKENNSEKTKNLFRNRGES